MAVRSDSSRVSGITRAWRYAILLVILVGLCLTHEHAPDEAQDEWIRKGVEELRRALNVARRQNTNLAKNVILFIGDGMGISTVTAARIRAGQLRGERGEENLLSFERFPHVSLIKTYSVDSQVTGSAAAGNAILTGIKINSGVLGCDSRVKKGNCSLYNDSTRLKTILHTFIEEGLSTGIVTNSRITHATPAAAYAQTPHRGWEGDVDLPSEEENANCQHVDDIAKQLVRGNSAIKVLLGGGRRYFLNNSTPDPVTDQIDPYQRRDGLDLIQEWMQNKQERNASHRYVWSKQQLDTVNVSTTDYLLGLFNPSHLDFEVSSSSQQETRLEPTLVEMTEKAIQILKKDSKGFFLLVEGARIDFGHHANSAYTAITETLEFDEAVKTAVRMTKIQNTLILVTADHSHAFAIQGYAPRGNDILGTADSGSEITPLDGLPYTTLGYTNGPAYGRADLTNVDTASPNFRQTGCIPFSVETHAGEDVSAYGRGPLAHLLHATHEQNYLHQLMEYAACVGRSKRYCNSSKANSRGNRQKQ